MQDNSVKKSIMEMARGAFMERADYEMARVVDNILDVNTKATAKRKVTITMEFTPDDERSNVGVSVTVKSALATTNPVRTNLYIAGEKSDGTIQVVEMIPNIPGQLSMDSEEPEVAPVLKLVGIA